MKRRITRIKVQTEREVIFNAGDGADEAWCAVCAKSVPVVDSLEAAALLGLDSPQTLSNRDGIHLVEATKGSFLICLESLQDHSNPNNQN